MSTYELLSHTHKMKYIEMQKILLIGIIIAGIQYFVYYAEKLVCTYLNTKDKYKIVYYDKIEMIRLV